LKPNSFNLALAKGGLAQLTSLPGGSCTRYALTCFQSAHSKPVNSQIAGHLNSAAIDSDPPSPSVTSDTLLWVSDVAYLSPNALAQHWNIAYEPAVHLHPPDATQSWRAALEGVQTGLFHWVFIKPSQNCATNFLRKLQISARKNQTRVCVFPPKKLPHWFFKVSLEVSPHPEVSLEVPYETSPQANPSLFVSPKPHNAS